MRCLRDILGLTLWDMHQNVDILKAAGELPVEEQLRHMRLQWIGHVEGMPDHHPQKQLLRCRPQGKRRRPGGASLRWIDVVSRDLNGVQDCKRMGHMASCCAPAQTCRCVMASFCFQILPNVLMDKVQKGGGGVCVRVCDSINVACIRGRYLINFTYIIKVNPFIIVHSLHPRCTSKIFTYM